MIRDSPDTSPMKNVLFSSRFSVVDCPHCGQYRDVHGVPQLRHLVVWVVISFGDAVGGWWVLSRSGSVMDVDVADVDEIVEDCEYCETCR